MLFSIRQWRTALLELEQVMEIRQILKSGLKGHRADGTIGLRQQP